jgi:hypothetical protein
LGVTKLPNVHMMAADDAWNVFNIFFDILDIDMIWSRLEKNLGGRRGQGDGGAEDNQSDEKRHSRIRIVSTRPGCEPNNKRRYDNTDIAESVSNNVENHSIHTHIIMAMAMASLRCLFRLVVVVTSMPRVAP